VSKPDDPLGQAAAATRRLLGLVGIPTIQLVSMHMTAVVAPVALAFACALVVVVLGLVEERRGGEGRLDAETRSREERLDAEVPCPNSATFAALTRGREGGGDRALAKPLGCHPGAGFAALARASESAHLRPLLLWRERV